MIDIDIANVLKACDTLSQRIITIGGKYHGSAFIFDQCMRAFDCKSLPAQAVTFDIFINAPVMKPGRATIYRDGRLEMHTI